MILDIDESTFRKIEKPATQANNYSFDLQMTAERMKVVMPMWDVWTNAEHDALYIKFKAESRTSIDKLEMALASLVIDYRAEVNFVNPSTLELSEQFKGGDLVGILYIKGIKLERGDLYLAG